MTDNGSEEEEGNVCEKELMGGKERDRMKGVSEGGATVFCELQLK